MSKKWKYIIVSTLGHEVPILFHPLIEHDRIVGPDSWNPDYIVSAGFCETFISRNEEGYDAHIDICVYGGSTSLKKQSRPKDREIILRTITDEIY